MARKLVVEIIADPRNFTRGLQTANRSAKTFGAEMESATRGALTGTAVFKGFGRSLAFASGGFLAFEGATRFLTDSINAARDAGVAQRSLAAQMKASGESFQTSGAQVEKASLSLEKYGFTSVDSEKALTVLERGTGSIAKAISLQGTAADLARAKNIDLASAANVLAKVFGGQETALRRAVPGLDKHAHGLDLIREAQARLAGQAAAGTTVSERFAATLHDTERIVGEALLPILNKYLTSLSNWLQKMNQSGKLQKDVNAVVKTATGLINAAKGALEDLNKVTGSTKETLKLLFGAFVAFKTAKLAETMLGIATNIGLIGTKAEGSTGAVVGLRAAFGKAGLAAAVALAGYELSTWIRKIPGWDNDMKDFGGHIYDVANAFSQLDSNTVSAGDAIAQYSKIQGTFGTAFANKVLPISRSNLPGQGVIAGFAGLTPPDLGAALGPLQPRIDIPGGARGLANGPLNAMQQLRIALARRPDDTKLLQQLVEHDNKAIAFAKTLLERGTINTAKYTQYVVGYITERNQAQQKIADAVKKGQQPRGITVEQRNTWFDNMISRALGKVSYIPTLQGQIGELQRIDDLLAKQIAVTKDITRKHMLQDEVLQNQNTILDDQKQIAAANAQKAADAAQKHQEAIQTQLGWLQLNVDKAGLTAAVGDDIAAIDHYIAAVKTLIAKEGDSLALEQDLLSHELSRQQIIQQQADARKAAAQAARQAAAQAAQQAAQAAQQAELGREYGLLGLGPTGGERIRGLQSLRVELRNVSHMVTEGLIDVDAKTKAQLRRIKRTLRENSLQPDVRQWIQDFLDPLRDGTKKADADWTKFRTVNTKQFIALAGLSDASAAERRRVSTLLSMMGPHSTLPGAQTLAFAGGQHRGITINGGVHMHGVQDVAGLENDITRRARQRPSHRRGS